MTSTENSIYSYTNQLYDVYGKIILCNTKFKKTHPNMSRKNLLLAFSVMTTSCVLLSTILTVIVFIDTDKSIRRDVSDKIRHKKS
jgi:hypothetical protein